MLRDIGHQARTVVPHRGAGPIPPRRSHSIRRTATIDICWPNSWTKPFTVDARSRDIRTGAKPADGIIHDQAAIAATLSPQRNLLAIEASGHDQSLAELIGARVTGRFRPLITNIFPSDEERQSGIYLLLDDLKGAILVSNWARHCWGVDDPERTAARNMTDACIGLAAGSAALDHLGQPNRAIQSSAFVPELANPDDPAALHPLLPAADCPSFRRARWIDLSRDGDDILLSSGFQDSAVTPLGARRAVHEYRIDGRIAADGTIAALHSTPFIVPFATCPAATVNLTRLIGAPVSRLRETVPQLLAKDAGCTHQNDMLRALACVPRLAAATGR